MALSNLEKLALLLGDDEMQTSRYQVPLDTDGTLVAHDPNNSVAPYPFFDEAEYDRLYGPAYNNQNLVPILSSSDEEYNQVAARKSTKAPKSKSVLLAKNSETGIGVCLETACDSPCLHSASVVNGETCAIKCKDTDIGRLAMEGVTFSPIVATSKYPYKFVQNEELAERIAQEFFADAKFWRREWDVYYVWPPFSVSPKPLLLIRTQQVEELLADINRSIPESLLVLTSEAELTGLVLNFDSHPQVMPRYLGHANSKAKFDTLGRRVPGEDYRPSGEAKPQKPPATQVLADFKRKMELAVELSKNKTKASKETKRELRTAKQQGWRGDLRQTECFLGLRPKASPEPKDPFENIEEEWQITQQKQAAALAAKHIPAINIHRPCPYEFEQFVIFISIDIECYEKDKSKVTEIGFSTLDTKDLVGKAPGEHARNWRSSIRSRHLRIREHAHFRNTEYVEGNPAAFLFGDSEFVTLADAPSVIAQCFRPPYSGEPRNLENGMNRVKVDPSYQAQLVDIGSSCSSETEEKRNLVLVGHDVTNDLRYLRSLGYDTSNLSNLTSTIDTAVLYRALMREWNPKSLGGLMLDFDIAPYQLHNGGNDARYTMEVMLAIAIKSAVERGTKEQKKRYEEKRKERVEVATREAAVRALEEAEGWSSDDGGVNGNGVKV